MSQLEKTELQKMISRCNRCGFCQDVCPTYSSSKNEFDVARGRVRMMRMIQEGQYDLTADKAILKQVDQCLLCGACVANCPSRVPTDTILRITRQTILEKKGFSLFHKLLYRGVLTRPERLEKISAMVRVLDCTNIRNLTAKAAANSALDFLSDAATYLPEKLLKPARKSLENTRIEDHQADICYFLGCGTNAFTPKAGIAAINCLKSMGYSVDIPEFSCCGGPHFASGDIHKARTLARKNIAILAAGNHDIIISDCATCAHTLHDYASFFPKDDPVQEDIKKLVKKVKDINTFVLEHVKKIKGYQNSFSPIKKTIVTYHDPCHAVRGLNVSKAPRDILKTVPGVEIKEMDGAASCCGGAGSYSFRHPLMSKKILDKKINAIADTGASILATSCPSCILQLSAGLRRNNLNIRVVHPMELLFESFSKVFKTIPHGQHPLKYTKIKSLNKGAE